jgi:perosamine synthetase
VLSGNTPRFIDIDLDDYNMNLDLFAGAINEKTQVVMPTHLFGCPMDIDRVAEIVADAEQRYEHKIWVIQDCAHSFGAKWQDRSVCAAGDAALFGLNISKTITSVFGGMISTSSSELAARLRGWRDEHFHPAGRSTGLRRRLYLAAIYPAFWEPLYGLVYWIQTATPVLKGMTDAYHLDDQIHFPPDYLSRMTPFEAQVGLVQLQRYAEIIRRRQATARFYTEHLPAVEGWEMPPLVDGATYSHYVIRVPDRDRVMRLAAARGVQIGQLIEYSIPHLESYRRFDQMDACPYSLYASQHTINLPIYPWLSDRQCRRVVEVIREIARQVPGD